MIYKGCIKKKDCFVPRNDKKSLIPKAAVWSTNSTAFPRMRSKLWREKIDVTGVPMGRSSLIFNP